MATHKRGVFLGLLERVPSGLPASSFAEKRTPFFVSERDTLQGVKILKIADRQVKYSYNKKDTIWTVAR